MAEWAAIGGLVGLGAGVVFLITIAVYLPEDEDLPWEAFSDAFDLVTTGATIGLICGALYKLWLRIRPYLPHRFRPFD